MTTKPIDAKTVHYFCSVCGHDYGRLGPDIKPYYGNSKTGKIDYCIKCGHEFYSNPLIESERPV